MKAHPFYERPGTDYEEPVFQESNFYYLTGDMDECSWLAWDLEENKFHLFHFVHDISMKMWMKTESLEDKKRYPADFHHTLEELPVVVNTILGKGRKPVRILEITSEAEVREQAKIDAAIPVVKTDLQYFLGVFFQCNPLCNSFSLYFTGSSGVQIAQRDRAHAGCSPTR
jgi:hypothetical protein